MKIRISNISDNISEERIMKMLSKYGNLSNFRLISDRYTAKDLKIVYVEILDEKKGEIALQEMNELILENEQIEAKLILNQ